MPRALTAFCMTQQISSCDTTASWSLDHSATVLMTILHSAYSCFGSKGWIWCQMRGPGCLCLYAQLRMYASPRLSAYAHTGFPSSVSRMLPFFCGFHWNCYLHAGMIWEAKEPHLSPCSSAYQLGCTRTWVEFCRLWELHRKQLNAVCQTWINANVWPQYKENHRFN